MCLGIPGKVIETYREQDVLMGKVDYGGMVKSVCLEHVPHVRPGQYVIVHVGYALVLIEPSEAQETIAFLERMRALEEPQPPADQQG
jgi:hydrogenase expression/formation protein HypC